MRQQPHETISATGRVRSVQHPLDAAVFHPLASRVAIALSKTPVTPNMVSIAGGVAIILAAWIYADAAWPYSVIFGFAIHACWHVLDGADGDLARLTGKASPSGEIVDGICDYAGHIVLYLMLGHLASLTWGLMGWILAIAAGLSRILQANFYESQRRQYMQWMHGLGWLRTEPDADRSKAVNSALARAYLWLSDWLAPTDPAVDRALKDPSKATHVKAALERAGPKALYGSDFLGAPYRTIGLGLAMLAGNPEWYFLFEIVVLNIVLATSVARARRTLRDLNGSI